MTRWPDHRMTRSKRLSIPLQIFTRLDRFFTTPSTKKCSHLHIGFALPASYCKARGAKIIAKDHQEKRMKPVRSLSIAAAMFLGVAALLAQGMFAKGMHGHGPDGEFGHLLGF